MSVQTQAPTAKPNTRNSWLGKVCLGLLKFCLGFVLVVSLLLAFCLTPFGTKVLINAATGLVDELSIEYHSGAIGSDLHLSKMQWQQPTSQVNISDLKLSINLACVWRLSVCVDSISTDKIIAQLQAASPSANQQQTSTALTLPLLVSIKNIQLNQVSLKVLNTVDISWQKLTGQLDFYQRLRIENMQLDGLNLITYPAKDAKPHAQAKPFDWAKWQYQPIQPLPVVLPIHFEVLGFTLSDTRVQLAEQKPLVFKKVSLKAKASKTKIQLDELLIEHQQGQLLAKGNVQLKGLFEHNFTLNANAQWAELKPLTIDLRSSGNIHALTSHLDLIEQTPASLTTSGRATTTTSKLTLQFSAKPSSAQLPLELKGNWQHLFWPLVQPQVISESGVIDINGNLSALKLTLESMLSGQALPDAQIRLDANATSTTQGKKLELNQFLIETLGGKVSSQGQLMIADYINWQGSTEISHIDPSVKWPTLLAEINGQMLTQVNNRQGVIQGKVEKLAIKGQWQGYPLSMSGDLDFHQINGLQLNQLRLQNADNVLRLDGRLSKQKALDVSFSLDANDLSTTVPQLSGTLNLSGDLSGSFEQPKVSYQLSASELMFWEVYVEQAVGQGQLVWNDTKPVDLQLKLTGMQGNNNQVETAQIQVVGDAMDHQLDLSTSGEGSSINLSIQGQLDSTSWQGRWLSGDIQSTYAHLTLPEPFEMYADWSQQHYNIAPHCWRHSDNEFCIKQAQFKQNIARWDISLKEFDLLSVASRLMPGVPNIQTNSRLNLDVSGDWDLNQLPNAKLSASLSPADWVFNQKNKLALTFDETLVEAQINQKSIQAKVHLSGSQFGKLQASVEGQSGLYADPLSRPIQGEFGIQSFDLGAFKALFPELDVLQGMINGQAKIDGTLGSPLLTGELALQKGALKDEALPVALSEIQQNIQLNGQSAEFTGTYKLGKGLGKMHGDIAWTPNLKGQLHISGEELEFDYQSMLKAKVSPNIDVKFAPDNLNITGEVTVPYARIKVRELPKDTISPSKDVILVEKQAEQNASQQRLDMNVLLRIDPQRSNNVKLDAFGLTTDLRGQLRIQNNKDELFGSGEVQLVNGRYRAYGQNLLIREGDILFNSALDRPFLSIEAVRDPSLTADDVVAGLRVEGVPQNPSVSVFSEPVMEQQQMLSYMLTGRALGESSGDTQDTILTNALLSLGLGKSENLISKVGNKLGFDDVNLETTGQGDGTQLSLSGTIAPGVQLRYGVGVFDSISEVAIRYELIPKLYIEAVSGVSNAIDIYYQFSIEGSQNKKVKDD